MDKTWWSVSAKTLYEGRHCAILSRRGEARLFEISQFTRNAVLQWTYNEHAREVPSIRPLQSIAGSGETADTPDWWKVLRFPVIQVTRLVTVRVHCLWFQSLSSGTAVLTKQAMPGRIQSSREEGQEPRPAAGPCLGKFIKFSLAIRYLRNAWSLCKLWS